MLVSFAGTVWQPLGLQKVATADLGGFAGIAVGSGRGRPFRIADRARSGRSSASCRAPTRPGSTSSRCIRGPTGWRWTRALAAGARGLVLEALGSGNAGAAVIDAVRRHCRDGVAVAVSTRVPGGKVGAGYGPGRELVDAGAVMVPRLRPPQTRVLLMAALASGSSVDDVVARWG